jgi:hypothetical protein
MPPFYRASQMHGLFDDATDVAYDVYDPRDAMAQGTAVAPIDTTIYDANDARAAGTGGDLPSMSPASSGGFSLQDLVNAGSSLWRTVTGYQTTTLPGGSTIYTRTGQPAAPAGSGNMLALLAIGGLALYALSRKKRG